MAWIPEKDLASKFKRVGRGVKISNECLIYGSENIEVGDNVRIDAQTLILCAAGSLKIGSHVHVASKCLLSCRGGIVMGDFTDISMGAMLISASDDAGGEHLVGPVHPEYLTNVFSAPIVMDHYSWIGAGAIVLPGARMGQGSMLGTFGLLTPQQKLEPWKIYIGQPARYIKDRAQGMVAKSIDAQKVWDDDMALSTPVAALARNDSTRSMHGQLPSTKKI